VELELPPERFSGRRIGGDELQPLRLTVPSIKGWTRSLNAEMKLKVSFGISVSRRKGSLSLLRERAG